MISNFIKLKAKQFDSRGLFAFMLIFLIIGLLCLVSLEPVNSPGLSEVIISWDGPVLLQLNSNNNRLKGVQLDNFVSSPR